MAAPTPMLTTIFSSRGSDVAVGAAQLLGQRRQDLLVVTFQQTGNHFNNPAQLFEWKDERRGKGRGDAVTR